MARVAGILKSFGLVASLALSATVAQSAPAGSTFGQNLGVDSENVWTIKATELKPIAIQSAAVQGRLVDVMTVPYVGDIAIPIEPSDAEDRKAYESLSEEAKSEVQTARRSIFSGVLNLLLNRRLVGTTYADTNVAYTATIPDDVLKLMNLRAVSVAEEIVVEHEKAVASGDPVKIETSKSRIRSFLLYLNDAIIGSTIRAFKQFIANFRDVRTGFTGFGITIAVKTEFQFGVGQKFNVTRNSARLLRIGYDRESGGMIIRLARRTEEMDSGSAFSAGPKVEVRGWVKKPTQATESGAVAGKTWYPPSLPVIGLVADTTAGYSEVGVVFGLNVSDFIPGSTFINTVNNFTETEKTFRFMKEPPLTMIATKIREAREKRRLLNSPAAADQLQLTASMKKAFCKRSLEHSNQNEIVQMRSKRAIGF